MSKQYICDCGKSFDSQIGLTGHQSSCKIHRSKIGKPVVFVCSVCGKQFSSPSALKTHMRIHTGESKRGPSRKQQCPHCQQYIGVSVYERHVKKCKGVNNKYNLDHSDLFCKFCGKECKNTNSLIQHEIRCSKNPNRKNYSVVGFNNCGKQAWNKGLTAETDERLKLHSEQIKKALTGRKGKPHTEEFKKRMSKLAVERELGGFNLRKPVIIYKGVTLDSSYELKVAQSLDENNVLWERCKRFPYIDPKGVARHYTPDFYLPQYDVYLDPKRDLAIYYADPKVGYTDVEKINCVMQYNNIVVIVLDKDNLTWDKIKSKIEQIKRC